MLAPEHQMDPSAVIQYLRACYEADNREGSILDLRREKVQFLTFLSKGRDFMTGALPVAPVLRERGVEAQKAAELFLAEKTLVFGAFLLTGHCKTPRGKVELCAPLYLFPARVKVENGHAFLEPEIESGRINTRALAALQNGEDGGDEEGLATLLAEAPMPPFQPTGLYDLAALLEAAVPGIDTACLMGPCETLMEAPPVSEAPRCHNAFVMALLPNSVETRGVLSELAQLGKTPDLSPPLRALLGADAGAAPRARPWRRPPLLPASLTRAQHQATLSARSARLGLLVGPPGTGKTFTLATLVADHAIQGRSVLVATRTEEALDVLEAKLRHFLGPEVLLMRGGRGDALRSLKEGLARLLRGSEAAPPPAGQSVPASEILNSHRMLERKRRELARHWEDVAHLREMRLAETSADGLAAWWWRLRGRWTARRLERDPSLTRRLVELQQEEQEHRARVAAHIRGRLHQNLASARGRRRQLFVKLDKALRSRTHQRLAALYDTLPMGQLLHLFPIWLCPMSDLNRLLPLRGGMFDLAVVDEATQVDMASCLPVFHRAKRVVVSGDHKQLRHVSFLANERQRQLARKFAPDGSDGWAADFDFRNQSLLDLLDAHFASQRDLTFLDEHHRSEPELIAFSNAAFYEGRLRVMKWRADPSPTPPPLRFVAVGGERRAQGHNTAEAEALMGELTQLVEAEKALPASQASSIGILSPLRHQVDHLEKLIAKQFELEQIRKHHLLVGTAHAFQGAERDIMLLSLAIGAEEGGGALRFISRPDLFNVAITRARLRQIIFHSLKPNDLPAAHLVRRYLNSLEGAEAAIDAHGGGGGQLMDEVAAEAQELGWEIRRGRHVAGVAVDLLLLRGPSAIALLPGPNPQDGPAHPFAELETLQRAGVTGLWLTRHEWTHAREPFLALLESFGQTTPAPAKVDSPAA